MAAIVNALSVGDMVLMVEVGHVEAAMKPLEERAGANAASRLKLVKS